jgi:hypothetical protein
LFVCGGTIRRLSNCVMQIAPRRADVVPGGKVLALARQHDAAHRIIVDRAAMKASSSA